MAIFRYSIWSAILRRLCFGFSWSFTPPGQRRKRVKK